MSEIPKAYEPQSVESKWYQHWLEKGCFTADPARVTPARPAYSIVIPPPNVTGMLHMGHVLNNTIQDILSRKARMDGKEVLWLPGTDHAGIATQTVVERTLKKSGEIKHRNDLGREKFLEKVWEWKEKHGGIILQQLKALGGGTANYDTNLAKVSVVGVGMKQSTGVAAKMFGALAHEKINIQNISTSEIRISCIIAKEDAEKALKAVHAAFDLGKA